MMSTNKIWLGVEEIKELFSCGSSSAYAIIREIKAANGGGKLGRGKILRTELDYWMKAKRPNR